MGHVLEAIVKFLLPKSSTKFLLVGKQINK